MKLTYREKISELIYSGNVIIGCYIFLFLLTLIVTFLFNDNLFNIKYNNISIHPIKSLLTISLPMFLALCLFPIIIEKTIKKSNPKEIGFVHFSKIDPLSKGIISVCIIVILMVFILQGWSLVLPLFIHYLIVGLGEEILFRGIFQRRLQKVFNPYTAIIITSFIFAFQFHTLGTIKENLFYRLPLGLLLGFVYYKCKNIWPNFMIHTAYNFVLVSYN